MLYPTELQARAAHSIATCPASFRDGAPIVDCAQRCELLHSQVRWRHAVAAVQAAAISHGRIQDVYEHAAEVMHFA